MDEEAIRRSYKIIKLFVEVSRPSSDLVDRFHEWLTSEPNSEAKWAAVEMIFGEVMAHDFEAPRLTELMPADHRDRP